MPRDDSTPPELRVPAISRRDALRWLGSALASAPLASVLACEGSTDDGVEDEALDGGSSPDAGASAGADAGGADAESADGSAAPNIDAQTADATQAVQADAAASGWARGGTAAMTALVSYPDPFSGAVDTSCTPTCELTLGPCHDDQAPEREDISEGQTGLPMRFALRILDDNCQPVTDADVDIWHCDVRGVYSSSTNDSPGFCTGNDATALAARWFRGHRTTDANGVAWFSTCFPGWYSSRAIHVHFTVRRPNRAGTEYLTSQLAFPSDLIAELCTSHPDYVAHGAPDTSNTSDTVFPAATVDAYTMQTERMSDGALLAWKTIIIRSSLTTTVCAPSGAAGGGGMMGGPPPPPDGGFGGPPGA